jgi:hypothetical protein
MSDDANPRQVLEDPDYLIGRIRDYVVDCKEKFAQDEVVGLTPLQGKIVELCDVLNAMPVDQAEKMNPKLQSLMVELDALAREIEAQKQRVTEQLGGLNIQQKANTAYEKAKVHAQPQPKTGSQEDA